MGKKSQALQPEPGSQTASASLSGISGVSQYDDGGTPGASSEDLVVSDFLYCYRRCLGGERWTSPICTCLCQQSGMPSVDSITQGTHSIDDREKFLKELTWGQGAGTDSRCRSVHHDILTS